MGRHRTGGPIVGQLVDTQINDGDQQQRGRKLPLLIGRF